MKRYYIRYTIYFILITLVCAVPIHAQEYILELHQIEATESVQLQPKISNSQLSILENQGYVIISSEEKPTEFAFSIDRTDLSFPNLREGGSFGENITLDAKSSTQAQYQILTKLSSPFQTISDQTIEPTTCDDGCTTRMSKQWKSENVFGWGYSIDEGKTYRPFSSQTTSLDTGLSSENSKTKIILKVQTPRSQPEGNFLGVIQMFALPEL
ncbi:hypothetical protein CO051_02280 [Candidatus Roizmanbacteria bacterium CG_4_9_14_0_2_um_filter_39_13]|uniref:Uncharacterized protein n=1 Tax=Candidatus Roizmanbacteria bacterium CG_4_9_14_0_2_um_filter_39_13 TaxID=1974839 RepID=A0A2M8F0U9_9BACT|nr:MAG: hypothetical protein COY15_03555 [Candidatus Roizmanbacteria bacterium CG_4_10_14_0_2_um_filter_39_12]PJC32922.1 MAG: hypothetical protein CO051_02280 [Candidatus Roizmanbacteria bacterium CG_4_9_14_0_2_um_filter_39_13]